MLTAVIMAGGKGERFWPRSRMNLPKQFLKLTDDRTMIQKTVERLKGLVADENIYISTTVDYKPLVREQLPQVPEENIILEPCGRNTAPCIGLAAVHIHRKHPNATMLVLPSDHLIKNEALFLSTLRHADTIASIDHNLVTIGIMPSHPETGYGYIQLERDGSDAYGDNVFKVARFVEKPDMKTAQRYVESGEYLWNSGMFVWKVQTILENYQTHLPEMYAQLQQIGQAIDSVTYEEILNKVYSQMVNISIDYGIMEKSVKIYVLPGIFGWDDVGSWNALERIMGADADGNVVRGNALLVNTENSIIEAQGKMIAVVGMENLIVVDTEDVILICDKDATQDIKTVTKLLRERDLATYL